MREAVDVEVLISCFELIFSDQHCLEFAKQDEVFILWPLAELELLAHQSVGDLDGARLQFFGVGEDLGFLQQLDATIREYHTYDIEQQDVAICSLYEELHFLDILILEALSWLQRDLLEEFLRFWVHALEIDQRLLS